MAEVKKGFAWHIHHWNLLGYCYDFLGRVAYIRENKPPREVPLRLRLFHLVKGELPAGLVRAWIVYEKAEAACLKTWAVYEKAGAAYEKAGVVYEMAGVAYEEAGVAYKEARAAYQKTWVVYEEAEAAYQEAKIVYAKALEGNAAAIGELHAQECPDCPWDGESIFPEIKEVSNG